MIRLIRLLNSCRSLKPCRWQSENEEISPEWVRGDVPEHRLVPAARPITIHDLITHTAGLESGGLGHAVGGRFDTERTPDDTLARVVPRFAGVPLDFQPGTRWAYSARTGLDVVARVRELVYHQPYEAFLRERIFDPLGMSDTYFEVPPDKSGRCVVIDGIDAAVLFLASWKLSAHLSLRAELFF